MHCITPKCKRIAKPNDNTCCNYCVGNDSSSWHTRHCNKRRDQEILADRAIQELLERLRK